MAYCFEMEFKKQNKTKHKISIIKFQLNDDHCVEDPVSW